MSDCVFCKILKNEIPASFVYRNASVSAFLDIHPINPGHVLVIPNNHCERFVDIEESEVGEMFKAAQYILKAIQKSSLHCEGANLFLSDGEVAGQEVTHSHLHIAPRFHNDGQHLDFNYGDTDSRPRSELDRVAREISQQLSVII